VSGNHVEYSPAISAPVVFEDDSITVFLGTEKNFVFSNQPIVGTTTNAFEFQNSPHSGSTVFHATIWFP
jgi:hypothetical protein